MLANQLRNEEEDDEDIGALVHRKSGCCNSRARVRRRARVTGTSYYLHRSIVQLQFAVLQQVMLS